eukprot:2870399-Rhodomonas_salina.1
MERRREKKREDRGEGIEERGESVRLPFARVLPRAAGDGHVTLDHPVVHLAVGLPEASHKLSARASSSCAAARWNLALERQLEQRVLLAEDCRLDDPFPFLAPR